MFMVEVVLYTEDVRHFLKKYSMVVISYVRNLVIKIPNFFIYQI